MTTLFDHYRLIRKIGSGGFSTIYLAVNEFGEQFAVKSMRKHISSNDEAYFLEARIHYFLSQCDEKVVHFYEMFEDDEYVHFVLEYLPGGDLFDTLLNQSQSQKFYSEKVIKSIVKGLLESVQKMHSYGIVHRDLKLENLLLKTKGNEMPVVKIADFGLAVEEHNIMTFAGTPLYMAPETHRREPYGKPVDMWAIGTITYMLCCGDLPFGNDKYAKARTLRGEFEFRGSEWLHTSALMRDFIKSLLNVDPSLRPTAEEAMNHLWFHYDNDSIINNNASMKIIEPVSSTKFVPLAPERLNVVNNGNAVLLGQDFFFLDTFEAIYHQQPPNPMFIIPPMETIFSIAH